MTPPLGGRAQVAPLVRHERRDGFLRVHQHHRIRVDVVLRGASVRALLAFLAGFDIAVRDPAVEAIRIRAIPLDPTAAQVEREAVLHRGHERRHRLACHHRVFGRANQADLQALLAVVGVVGRPHDVDLEAFLQDFGDVRVVVVLRAIRHNVVTADLDFRATLVNAHLRHFKAVPRNELLRLAHCSLALLLRGSASLVRHAKELLDFLDDVARDRVHSAHPFAIVRH